MRASGSVVPVRSLDEKLLPVEASSSNGHYTYAEGIRKRKAETIIKLLDSICRDMIAWHEMQS